MNRLTTFSLAIGTMAVFLLDISLPMPIAAGIFYVLLIFIGFDHKNPRMIYYLSGLSALLTVAGFFLPRIPDDIISALINRGLSLCAIAIVMTLLAQLRRQRSALVAASEALQAATRTAEQERRAALAASQAKSTFLALANHEMRTPLHAIIGYAEVILQSKDPPTLPDLKEYAKQILQAGRNLLRIVTDMLSLSRLSVGTRDQTVEDVDVITVVKDCARRVSDAASSARIKIDAKASHLEIPGDSRMIWRSLHAVIENAVKFSPAESPVNIRVARVSTAVRVEVSDHGIGISPEILERVGTPFLQEDGRLSRRYDGIGLGLALAQAFIHVHHGTMTIASVPDQGTVVTIDLPATAV